MGRLAEQSMEVDGYLERASEGSHAGEQVEEQISSILDICRQEDGKACVKVFYDELQKLGIRPDDPRLKGMYGMLKNLSTSPNFENLKLDPTTFKHVLSENIVFVTKAFQNRLVIPAFGAFCENITDIYHKLKLDESGEPDPFLKKINHVDETKFGISVCTIDGQCFSIGDATSTFCLQELCKPIVYGITLD